MRAMVAGLVILVTASLARAGEENLAQAKVRFSAGVQALIHDRALGPKPRRAVLTTDRCEYAAGNRTLRTLAVPSAA